MKKETSPAPTTQNILLEQGYVTQEVMQKAEAYAQKHHSDPIDYLLSNGLLTDDLLGQAVAESKGVHYANLNSHQPSKELVQKIPEVFAKKYWVVLFKEDENEVRVACNNPEIKKLGEELKKILKTKKKVVLTFELKKRIEPFFIHYQKALETRFSKIIKEQERIAPEIIDEILADALVYNTSDIHFEPQEKEVIIRFRVDGVMQEAGRLPKENYENVLNRIKVQSHLRIDEHFSAQDGSMRYHKDNKNIDIRVSITPILDGEKVVMRLLSQYAQHLTLNDLGLLEDDQTRFMEAAKKPFGMILVTGPTGSGKTTTLYGALKILNSPEVNIATIEDPVEYKVQGVNHIQVNEQTNLTFAKGLRSIVRQDPDIILVGEIRDEETAEIAVNAALSGHLLLSTFHSNDAATSIPRLLDMGVEPFLLSSTLELIIAQRLVRRICKNCRSSIETTPEKLKKILPNAKRFFTGKKITLYEGKGCSACANTGYLGRIAVYEFITVSQEIKNMILKNPSGQAIWELARKEGAKTMFEDGIEKVKNGITTIEELMRVASPEK